MRCVCSCYGLGNCLSLGMVVVWSFNGMVLACYGRGHYLDFGIDFGQIFCPRICLGLVSNLSGPSLGHCGLGSVSLSMLNNIKQDSFKFNLVKS